MEVVVKVPRAVKMYELGWIGGMEESAKNLARVALENRQFCRLQTSRNLSGDSKYAAETARSRLGQSSRKAPAGGDSMRVQRRPTVGAGH